MLRRLSSSLLSLLKPLPAPASSLLLLTGSQRGAVNFFQRKGQDVLWNTVTALNKGGARKGGAAKRQLHRPLGHFYKVGTVNASPMRVLYPGLNASLRTKAGVTEAEPMYIEEQSGQEREDVLRHVKTTFLRKAPKKGRGKNKEKLTPYERGFSGGKWLGQKMGHPAPRDGVEFGDFECYCFQLRRLSRMKASYRRYQYQRVLVFIGNGKGVGGWSTAKGPWFKDTDNMAKAIRRCTRNLFFVERFEERTIYQDFFAEFHNCRIFAQRQEPGFGVVAHPRIRKMCELLGIRDIYVRVDRAKRNYLGLCHAFVTGLVNQETHQQCADRTRLHVVELNPNRMHFPEIVASPMNVPVKSDEEVEPKERLRLDDFYGEGRFPLHWGPTRPWWINQPGHLHAEWTRHRYRNMEKSIIRLIADGKVKRWTRRERKKWTDLQNKCVETGLKPMPMGIGLSNWVQMEAEDEMPFLGNPNTFEAELEEEEEGELGQEKGQMEQERKND